MVRLCVFLIGSSAALLVRAVSAPDSQTVAGVAEFEAAYDAWDASRFGAAAELFRQASINAPEDPINFYWLGTAHFHLMLQLQSAPPNRTNDTAAAAASEAELSAPTTAVKVDKHLSESLA